MHLDLGCLIHAQELEAVEVALLRSPAFDRDLLLQGLSEAVEDRSLHLAHRVRRVDDLRADIAGDPDLLDVELTGSAHGRPHHSFRMTIGMITPEAGRVVFANKDVTTQPMYKHALAGMGYLSQEPSVFQKLTVEQNLLAILETQRLSKSLRHQRADELMAQFGLLHKAREFARTCSGGERRRLEIARALVTRPKLMLLDEPFAAVDPHTVEELQEEVRKLATEGIAMLAAELGLDEEADVFETDGRLGTADLMEIANLDIPELHDPPHRPSDSPELGSERNIFHLIRTAGSILLHHPYESFSSSVERFLSAASEDPKVRAIKMTLYRTSEEPAIIEYLINAARNGKQVAVVVELKARFDERANIGWANRLEEVGIHVTYGVMGLKTHCKLILVVRQDYGGIQRYAHLGTGNYHEGTARIYSDLGMLTSDDEIGEDLTELFNYLTTGYKPKRSYKKILPAPTVLKQALLDKIQREIDQHFAQVAGTDPDQAERARGRGRHPRPLPRLPGRRQGGPDRARQLSPAARGFPGCRRT